MQQPLANYIGEDWISRLRDTARHKHAANANLKAENKPVIRVRLLDKEKKWIADHAPTLSDGSLKTSLVAAKALLQRGMSSKNLRCQITDHAIIKCSSELLNPIHNYSIRTWDVRPRVWDLVSMVGGLGCRYEVYDIGPKAYG